MWQIIYYIISQIHLVLHVTLLLLLLQQHLIIQHIGHLLLVVILKGIHHMFIFGEIQQLVTH